MIDLAWKSTLILALAWATSWALRNRSAALRHLVWTSAFGVLLLLPVLTLSLPALIVPREAPLGDLLATMTAVDAAPARVKPASAPPSATPAPPHSVAFPDAPTVLLWLWAAGTAFCLLRLLIACLAIWSLRRDTARISETDAKEIAEHLGLRGPIEVLAIPAGEMPSSFGNSVFLPLDAARWNGQRRRAVLLHELAHVQRADSTVQILARIAWSVYWWNPLARIAWRALVDERERSVDDIVLQSGIGAADYASHLMELARSVRPATRMAPALVAMATQSKLEGRIMAILDSTRDRRVPGKYVALGLMTAALAIFVPIAALRAQEAAGPPADLSERVRFAVTKRDAATLETTAQSAAGLSEYETAKKLMKVALEVRAKDTGELSKEYGRSLLKMADLEWRTGDPAAKQSFLKASEVLRDQPESAAALMALAVMEIGGKNYDAAEPLLERAKGADPKAAARAGMWLGVIRERQERTLDADLAFRHAIELADPKSDDAANLLELHAQLLRAQNKLDEAGELGVRALAIRRAQSLPPVTSATPLSGVYKIGGGVLPPSLVAKVEPEYSPEARAAKYQGSVQLSVEVNAEGRAENLRVVRGLGLGLNENAMTAIRQWKFKPATKDGAPVPVIASIEVNFRLL